MKHPFDSLCSELVPPPGAVPVLQSLKVGFEKLKGLG